MAAKPTSTEKVDEEPSPQTLKYKKWVLKVSVHCEGCKRKVKKILHGIQGVYTVDVDTKLHKATVTGNVDSEILIRKLEKSGKHAELWPEKKTEQKEGNNKKNKGKQNGQGNPENNQNSSTAPTEEKPPESAKSKVENPAKTGGNVPVKEVAKVEQKNLPAGETPQGNAAGNGNKGGGAGNGGKKKKNKEQKGNNGTGNVKGKGKEGGEPSGSTNAHDGAARTQSKPDGQVAAQGSCTPGSNRLCEHPPSNNAPQQQQPLCVASYSTAYPSNNYTTAYYASPPAYMHLRPDSALPSDWSNDGASEPSDTFEMFSEENPNACIVM